MKLTPGHTQSHVCFAHLASILYKNYCLQLYPNVLFLVIIIYLFNSNTFPGWNWFFLLLDRNLVPVHYLHSSHTICHDIINWMDSIFYWSQSSVSKKVTVFWPIKDSRKHIFSDNCDTQSCFCCCTHDASVF